MVFSPFIVVVNRMAQIKMIKWSNVRLTSRLIHCQTSHTHYNLFKQVCYSLRQAQKRKWPLEHLPSERTHVICQIPSVIFQFSLASLHMSIQQRWECGGCFPWSRKEDLPKHSRRQPGPERGRVRGPAQAYSPPGWAAQQWRTASEGGLQLLMTMETSLSLFLYSFPSQLPPLPPSVSKSLSPSSMFAHGDWGQMALRDGGVT